MHFASVHEEARLARSALKACAPADLDARVKELQAESQAKKEAAETIAELNSVVKKMQAESDRAAAQAEANQKAAESAEATYKERQAKVRRGVGVTASVCRCDFKCAQYAASQMPTSLLPAMTDTVPSKLMARCICLLLRVLCGSLIAMPCSSLRS